MAPRVSIPTNAPLPANLRLDTANATTVKVLARLKRASLLTVALDWLDESNAPLCAPYLRADDDDDDDVDPTDLYPPESSLADLRELYTDMQVRKGSKRDVLDRILEGDWRLGLTLHQLAMADVQYLHDHPQSQRWSAYRIVPLKTPTPQQASAAAGNTPPLEVDTASLAIPRFHPSTFLQNLQEQVLPDVKAHYNFDRPADMALLLLRIFLVDSPYNTSLAMAAPPGHKQRRTAAAAAAAGGAAVSFDASRTIYLAFPDAGPYVYISKPQATGPVTPGETKSLRALVVEGVPKALSQPQARVRLQPTALTTRNLRELLHSRGAGRTNAAGGGWSVYADEKKKETPLNVVLPSPPLSEVDEVRPGKFAGERNKVSQKRRRALSPATERETRRLKRAKMAAQARFGLSARVEDGKGLERVDIVIDDAFPMAHMAGEDGEEADNDEEVPHQPTPQGLAGRPKPIDAALERARGPDDEHGDKDDDGGAWRPGIKMTFHGSHVFAGIRQLVEAGIVDGEKMPGWLTGEEGVTIGAVRHGRIRGHKGSGL